MYVKDLVTSPHSALAHIVLELLLESIVDLRQVYAFTSPVLRASTPDFRGLLQQSLVFGCLLLLVRICVQDDGLRKYVLPCDCVPNKSLWMI